MKYDLPTDYTKLDWRKGEKAIVRDQYVLEQNNKCFYCKESLSKEPSKIIMDKKIDFSLFPPNMLKYPIHLHHCHKTNMTIGAVHAYCNCVLWQYEGE
jgi:hypothetical protein